MNNNKVQTEQMLVFQQQTPALKTTHSLFDKVTFIKVNVPLHVSILLFVTQHRHGPPPHLLPSAQTLHLYHEYILKSSAMVSELCI